MTVLWPHTKTLVPAEPGYELSVEMLTPPFAKHTVTFMTNSVPYIITPLLFVKTKKNPRSREPESASTLIHGHKFHYNYLYQINRFPVKENPLITY